MPLSHEQRRNRDIYHVYMIFMWLKSIDGKFHWALNHEILFGPKN